jgi:hypothetical protein
MVKLRSRKFHLSGKPHFQVRDSLLANIRLGAVGQNACGGQHQGSKATAYEPEFVLTFCTH